MTTNMPVKDGAGTTVYIATSGAGSDGDPYVIKRAMLTQTPTAVTGTCTSSYVSALSWSCQNFPNKTIIVVNTHATLTMKYRIRGYAKSGSSYYNEIQAEYTLAASTSQPHVIQNSYDVITVEVTDGSGHATYAIDYTGGQ
jgi:hypothetical protein